MKLAPILGLVLLVALLGAGCTHAPKRKTGTKAAPAEKVPDAAAKDKFPSINSRMASAWIGTATRLQALDAVVWYHGREEHESAEGELWTGTVSGDIVYVCPHEAILIPAGTLTLRPNGSLTVTGPHRTIIARPGENPDWRVLMSM